MKENKGQTQLETEELSVCVDWAYKEDSQVLETKVLILMNGHQRTDCFDLLPRYPRTIDFMGKTVRLSFVETTSQRKLYIAIPNKQNVVERQTLSSWPKIP